MIDAIGAYRPNLSALTYHDTELSTTDKLLKDHK